MIVITQHENGLSIRGHAHYAEIGKDIICAAVSTLAQTLIYSIKELTADKIEYSMQPGTVDIKHGDLTDGAQLLLNSFFVGVNMIADSYPANVRIAQTDKQTEKQTDSEVKK